MIITLRPIAIEDLEKYRYWKSPSHKYHSLNGPYFPPKTPSQLDTQIALLKDKINTHEDLKRRLIVDENNSMIGEVSWYWKSKETNWLEIGIVIFDENNWGRGIGHNALKLWINYLFNYHKK